MIIEMKSSLKAFQLVGLYEDSTIPDTDCHMTYVSIGIIGSEGIDVYRHEWDEFVHIVQQIDKEMQKSKQLYEVRIKEWDDREIARSRKISEQESDDDSDEDYAA